MDPQPHFVAEIEQNTRTYQKLMAEAADRLMPAADVTAINVKKDVYDILSEHVRGWGCDDVRHIIPQDFPYRVVHCPRSVKSWTAMLVRKKR